MSVKVTPVSIFQHWTNGDGQMSQISGTNEPQMTCAISLAQNLERRERVRVNSALVARETLARKLKVGVGTIERLVRGRVKRVDAALRDKLQALLVRELETEIQRLSHELEIARQGGSHLASLEVGEIETHLSKARALLTGSAQ
jgi:hypothetical protein